MPAAGEFQHALFGFRNSVSKLRLAQLISVTVGSLRYAVRVDDGWDDKCVEQDQGGSKSEQCPFHVFSPFFGGRAGRYWHGGAGRKSDVVAPAGVRNP